MKLTDLSTGKCVKVFKGHADSVNRIAVSIHLKATQSVLLQNLGLVNMSF